MQETSEALQSLFYQYTHLPIGEKEISCPYWMNLLKKGVFGPGGGKGKPEQIVKATESEAQKAGIDLRQLSKEEIISFMKDKKIGVDCSGFVFWMLNAFDIEKGGNGIVDDIPNCSGSFVASLASVKLLTGAEVANPVQFCAVKVGDMIRLRRGKHLAVVTSLKKDAVGNLKEIEYAHSSSKTEIEGVHLGIVIIKDPSAGLKDQQWEEKDSLGNSYDKQNYHPSEGDGIGRLKIWT